jgi:hypothetical protein
MLFTNVFSKKNMMLKKCSLEMFLDMHLVTLLVLLLVMLLAILPEKFEPEIAPGMNPAWRKNVILAANEKDLRKCSMELQTTYARIQKATPGSILTGPWNTGILVGML